MAGGNCGVWPKHLSAEFETVDTFEPDPLNFRCLAANAPEENIFKFNAGLGWDEYPSGMERTDNCGAHRIDGAGNIPVMNVDDLRLRGCDFIQLDIEGMEHDALHGASTLIKVHHPVIMIEDKANGPAIIDTLKREAAGFIVHAVNPMGGKVARAEAAAVQFRQGREFLPRHAPWLSEYPTQLLAFPSGTFDDLVDETSQVLNYCAGTGPMTVSTATYGYGDAALPTVRSMRQDDSA